MKKRIILLGLCAGCLLSSVVTSVSGTALRLLYDGVTGNAVSNLTGTAMFPTSPTGREAVVQNLEAARDIGEHFGSWIRGYIEAPQTGAYIFSIASDDDAELWLSSDHTAGNLAKIAENIGYVEFRDFLAKPMQKSAPVNLVRGQKYYFEVLHIEDFGGDHVSIGWELPDGTREWPIPGVRLMPFPVNETSPNVFAPRNAAPQFLTEYFGATVASLASTTVEEGRTIVLAATIEATQPVVLQWFRGSTAIAGENLSTLIITNVALTNDGAQFSLVASNALGSTPSAAITLSVSADTTAPALVSAFKRNENRVAVVFSESVEIASGTNINNYSLDNDATVTAATFGSSPNMVLLATSTLTPGTAYSLTVNNVRDRASTPNTIASPSTIALEQSMKLWLRLDETNATTAADSSGNGLDATLVNGPQTGFAGPVNGALQFDGLDDYGDLPDGFDDFTGGMTVAVWARPTGYGNWERFIDFGNGAGQNNILFARVGTSRNLAIGLPGISVIAPSAIENNVWQHLAATIDSSGSAVLFRNGIPLVTNFLGVPPVVVRVNNYVGRSNWAQDGYYSGKMDDLRVYARTLTQTEIEALAAADPAMATVDLVASDAEAAEQGQETGAIRFTRSGSTSAPLTVSYLVTGTATPGSDYTTLPGTVTIPAGTNAALVTITPIDDAVLDPSETVILTLAASSTYSSGSSDNAAVTIVDNEDSTPPQVAVATLDSAITIWFDEPLSAASVTNRTNYVLAGTSVTVTSASLTSRGTGVYLTLSAPIAETGVTVTVSNVRDLGGNRMSARTVPLQRLLSQPVNLVANAYHSPDTRAASFALVTNGIVDNINEPGGFDTFSGLDPTPTDFAGLIYSNAQDFKAIKVDLGRQFGDGGNWEAQPKVYVLKNSVDPNTTYPESDPGNWMEVPAVLVSGSVFDAVADTTLSPSTPVVFDLSSLPANQRTGFGWAVGGVRGDGGVTFISITELRGYGTSASEAPPQLVAARNGNGLLLSWPVAASGYVLETKPVFSTNLAWAAVTNPPVPSGSDNVVTLPISGNSSFFRLRQ